MGATDAMKKAAITKLMNYLLADPEKNINKIMDTLEPLLPKSVFPSQRESIRNAIEQKNNWYQLIMKIMTDINPEVRDDLLKTFVIDANLLAWTQQEKSRKKYECNIPWAILLDPTSACNLHCTGCWAADYGNALNLSYDDIDSIITQGKELGVHIYIYTGGEPLVRKKDLIKLCEAHPDCAFLCFTNATLIDEEFCQEMIRVKNFVPAISAEGDEASTDSRRGEGTYQKVDEAMDLLRSHGLPFGVSICYTSVNSDSVTSEEYIDWLIDKGALFAWIFTYMPVGKDSPTDLMPTPEQREKLYLFNDKMRQTKPLFSTTANMLAVASLVDAATCTSMLQAMSSRACSFTIRTRTSTIQRCSIACVRPSSWSTTTSSPSTITICVPARCSRILNASSTWWLNQARILRIWSRRKALKSCVRRRSLLLRHGHRSQSAFGPTRKVRVSRTASATTSAWRRLISRSSRRMVA